MKKSRANVPPPPSQLPESNSVPASRNMTPVGDVPMTFVMPRVWHTRFKQTAAAQGISMKELLFRSFEAWEKEERSR